MKGKIISNWNDGLKATHKDHIVFIPTGDTFDINVIDHNGTSRNYSPVGAVQATINQFRDDIQNLKGLVTTQKVSTWDGYTAKIQALESFKTGEEAGIGTW